MEYEANGDFWARMTCSRYGEITIGKISGSRRTAVRTDATAKFAEDGVVHEHRLPAAATATTRRSREHLHRAGRSLFLPQLPARRLRGRRRRRVLADLAAGQGRSSRASATSSSLIGCRITDAQAGAASCSPPISTRSTRRPGLRDPKTRHGHRQPGAPIWSSRRSAAPTRRRRRPRGRGIRAARYKLVLEEIRRRFAEPMLNGERIARALGVSKRYIQQLFEENGRTLSARS